MGKKKRNPLLAPSTRKKPGPKPMPLSERKTTKPSFRINIDLLMRAHEAAFRAGVGTSEWMRRAIIEKLDRDS